MHNNTITPTLMIIEDHDQLQQRLKEWLKIEYPDLQITTAPDGASALKIADISPPDILIVDLGLPDMRGDVVAAKIANRYPDIKTIVITVMEGSSYREAAQACDAVAFIPKRRIYAELLPVLDSLLSNKS